MKSINNKLSLGFELTPIGATEWFHFYRVVVVLISFLSRSALAVDVSTGFEGISQSSFVVGTSPISATFTGGVSQTAVKPGLYHGGIFSWHINGNNTGIVDFENGVNAVEFWIKGAPGASPAAVRVIDENQSIILTENSRTSFSMVNLARSNDESLIARIEVENTGGADIVIDDFGFSADVPVVFDPANPIPDKIPVGDITITLEALATGLVAPNWGVSAPGDSNSLYVADQAGTITQVELDSGDSRIFHDLGGRLVDLGVSGPGGFDERGLLGLAFHPDFASNGLFYTYTSEPASGVADFSTLTGAGTANHQSVILEWAVTSPNASGATVNSAPREILRIDQPQFNHDGGALSFGMDGLLYIALGDGGGSDDEGVGHGAGGNGRDPATVLGSLLRIDPLGSNAANGNYGIPASNPFVGEPGLDEIFAYGLRNPFRFSFDRITGALWLADVGQGAIEEVNLVSAGDNLGWNHKEGSFFFSGNGAGSGSISEIDPGVPAGLVDPVAQYDHDEGVAIIGGFVYRGAKIDDLFGRYVFGDYSGNSQSGRLFYLNANNAIRELPTSDDFDGFILGWGQDTNGEIYLMANTSGVPFGSTGTVYRVVAAGTPQNEDAGGSGSNSLLMLVMLLSLALRQRLIFFKRATTACHHDNEKSARSLR